MADIYPDTGKAFSAGLITGAVTAPGTYYIAWGTGAGTAGAADTALFTETDARVAATTTRQTTTVTNDTAQFVATLTAAGSRNITNAGVFNASSAGTLIQKSDHATVPLVTGDSIAYTFRLKHAQA